MVKNKLYYCFINANCFSSILSNFALFELLVFILIVIFIGGGGGGRQEITLDLKIELTG